MLWGADKKTKQEIGETGLETQQGSSTRGMGWDDTPSSDHRCSVLIVEVGKYLQRGAGADKAPPVLQAPGTHLLQPRDDAAVVEQVIAR